MAELSCKNVFVKEGNALLLEDISLSVVPGEMVSIVGLNGAGKSTLLKVLAGIIRPSSGSVQQDGVRLGYVPQFTHIEQNVPLGVMEFLSFFSKGKTKDEMLSSLDLVGAKTLSHKCFGSLSGGEKQRVLLALALLQDANVLLLDEPTAGVDVIGEKQFYDLLADLNKNRGVGIVLVSHDIHHVYKYVHRIVCLDKRIVCQGNSEEVLGCDAFAKHFHDHLAQYEHSHD